MNTLDIVTNIERMARHRRFSAGLCTAFERGRNAGLMARRYNNVYRTFERRYVYAAGFISAFTILEWS